MDFFDSRHFQTHKFLLSIVGFWPYQRATVKYFIVTFWVLCLITALVPQMIYIIKHFNNLDEVFEIMPILSGHAMCITKILFITKNSEKFKVLLRQTQEDWNNLLTNEETLIMNLYYNYSRTFLLAYLTCLVTFASCYGFLPLIVPILDIISPLNETRTRHLAHKAEYFVNQENYYYTLLLSEYMGYVACLSIAAAADSTYFFLVEHICGMHSILCHRLENCAAYNNLIKDNANDSNNSGRHIRHCILLDKRIRLFMERMESMFEMSFFFDIGFGFIFHTCTCIMIALQAGKSTELSRYVSIMILQCIRFFFNSWTGQEVIDHSFGISIAAYNMLWYDTTVEVQKMLKLLIARSQKPSQLTIAKFYIINLENFSTVIRTSTSYCTVMISLQKTPENV